MTTHSSVLAWRIPGTGDPGGLPSMGRTESDMTEATQQQQQHTYIPYLLNLPPTSQSERNKIKTVTVFPTSSNHHPDHAPAKRLRINKGSLRLSNNFNQVCTFFKHNAIAHLVDYSIVEHNFYMHWKARNFYVSYFIVMFTFLWWSRTKPVIYLKFLYVETI